MPSTVAMAASRSSAAKSREPGAPVDKDAVDPELVSLRGPRAQVGAITAFVIVVVCAVFLGRLYGDLRFAFGGEAKTVSVDDIVANRVSSDEPIAVAADVERSAVVRIRNGAGDPGQRLVPVVGSGDRVWVAIPGDAWAKPSDGHYTGRLHDVDAGPLGPALRAYTDAPQAQFISGTELRRARQASADGGAVSSLGGPQLKVTGDTPVELDVVDPAAALVTVTFTDRQPDLKAWTDALVAAGILPAATEPTSSTATRVTWLVRSDAPGGAKAATEKKLEAAQLWASRVEPVTTRRKSTWKALAITDATLGIGDGAALPWSAVDVAALWVPRPLPADAQVLVVGEAPADYWTVKPLAAALALLALLFTWALWRAVKRDLLPVAGTR